jgi:hypothetical protein
MFTHLYTKGRCLASICQGCNLLALSLCVLQCLRLLGGVTAVRSPPDQLLPGRVWPGVAPNAAAVVLEMQATSMVSSTQSQTEQLLL